MLRVYLDNMCVSAITRHHLKGDEQKALDFLRDWHNAGKIVLETSRQSPREMERAPKKYQLELKKGLKGLSLATKDHEVVGFQTQIDQYGGVISNPLVSDIVDKDLYGNLLGLGLKPDDAKHYLYAAQNGYERFITLDKHFLNKREKLMEVCSTIFIQKPSALVAEIDAEEMR